MVYIDAWLYVEKCFWLFNSWLCHLRQINYLIEQEPACLLMCQNSHRTGKIAQLKPIQMQLLKG